MSDLLSFGGAVRSLGNGKFEAPLVLFTGPDKLDTYRTFFNEKTDYWVEFPTRLPLIYGHGFDQTLRHRRLGMNTSYKGRVETTLTDAGVWMQGQLDIRDEYEAFIDDLVQDGKMGTSSGASGHLIVEERVEGHEDARWVSSWPLVEASLTPMPAQPENIVAPVRSVLPLLSKSPIGSGLTTEQPVLTQFTEREMENALRMMGLSKNNARQFLSGGYKSLRWDAAGTGDNGGSSSTDLLRIRWAADRRRTALLIGANE